MVFDWRKLRSLCKQLNMYSSRRAILHVLIVLESCQFCFAWLQPWQQHSPDDNSLCSKQSVCCWRGVCHFWFDGDFAGHEPTFVTGTCEWGGGAVWARPCRQRCGWTSPTVWPKKLLGETSDSWAQTISIYIMVCSKHSISWCIISSF